MQVNGVCCQKKEVNILEYPKVTTSVQTRGKYYHIYIRYKDSEGDWRTTSRSTGLEVSGNNKQKVKRICSQIQKEWEDKLRVGSDMLVSNLFKKWLEDIKIDVQRNTYRGYADNMNNHIIPYFEKKKLALCDLKVFHLEEYYRAKIAEGLSPQTVKHHHQNISNALKYAMRAEWIGYNPAQLAKTPKAEKYKGNFLTPKQLERLISQLEGLTIRVPTLIGMYFGLRRSEVLGLTWDYVDFDRRTITIAKTVLQDRGGYYVKDSTKNQSSYRTLPMSNYIYDVLIEQKQHQEECRDKLKDNYVKSDFVCTWDNGELITPNYLTKNFGKLIKSSDLPKVRFHDLRHSTASNFFDMGFTAIEVSEWLGHSTPSTTLNYYAHIISDKSKLRMSESLNDMIAV